MEINLLPWREAHLRNNQNLFFKLVGAAFFLAIIFLFSIHSVFFNQVNYMKRYVTGLSSAKEALTQKINAYIGFKGAHEKIVERTVALEKLQWARFQTVQLLNELTRLTPPGMYLSKLSRKDNEVSISGVANSNLLIAQLMKSIDDSPKFDVEKLESVEKKESTQNAETQFNLKIVLTMSNSGGR